MQDLGPSVCCGCVFYSPLLSILILVAHHTHADCAAGVNTDMLSSAVRVCARADVCVIWLERLACAFVLLAG